jgi:DNA-binding IclR family transcriptional regulator
MGKKQQPKKIQDLHPNFEDSARGPASSAAARSLAILHAVSSTEGSVSAVDLAPRLGLPKPTVHRLMQVLEYVGYLQREPGGKRFIVGPMQTEMALDTLINSPQRAVRHNILRALVDELHETCNIAALAGDTVVCIDRIELNWPLRSRYQAGSRIPLHCTASGKLFLSQMPAHKRRRLLNSAPLKRFTDNTIINPAEIEKDLKHIRSTKTGLDREEFLKGLVGVAVPVFDLRGRMCATVSSVVSSERTDAEQIMDFVPALNRAAAAITETMKV